MTQQSVSVLASDLLMVSGAVLPTVDYKKMFEIATAVVNNPSLLTDFDADPEAAAKKINGFLMPPGFHLHIVDSSNNYHPAEADALSQISSQAANATWSRIEVRAGVGAIACIVCLWCG